MAKFLIKRLLSGILTLFIILTLVFFMVRIVGGNPVYHMLDPEDITPETVAEMSHELGLDRPLIVQYASYLWDILHGNWGTSYFNYQNVADNMLMRWEPTLLLTVLAVAIKVFIGIPLGVISASHRNSPLDYSVSTVTLILQTAPSFFLALMAMYLLAFKCGAFPLRGYAYIGEKGLLESLRYLALPSLALALPSLAGICRHTRSAFLGVMKEDYVRTAKAKGLPRFKVLYKHTLKNSISIISSIITSNIAALLGGSVVIERVFSIEGIGKLTLDSLHRRDYQQVQFCVLALAAIYVAINIIQDIIYKLIDPRIDFTN